MTLYLHWYFVWAKWYLSEYLFVPFSRVMFNAASFPPPFRCELFFSSHLFLFLNYFLLHFWFWSMYRCSLYPWVMLLILSFHFIYSSALREKKIATSYIKSTNSPKKSFAPNIDFQHRKNSFPPAIFNGFF